MTRTYAREGTARYCAGVGFFCAAIVVIRDPSFEIELFDRKTCSEDSLKKLNPGHSPQNCRAGASPRTEFRDGDGKRIALIFSDLSMPFLVCRWFWRFAA
jgi:hypothetical protein